jgi:hypothetical protein
MMKLSKQPVRGAVTALAVGLAVEYVNASLDPMNPVPDPLPIGAIAASSTVGDTGPSPRPIVNHITEVEYEAKRGEWHRISTIRKSS